MAFRAHPEPLRSAPCAHVRALDTARTWLRLPTALAILPQTSSAFWPSPPVPLGCPCPSAAPPSLTLNTKPLSYCLGCYGKIRLIQKGGDPDSSMYRALKTAKNAFFARQTHHNDGSRVTKHESAHSCIYGRTNLHKWPQLQPHGAHHETPNEGSAAQTTRPRGRQRAILGASKGRIERHERVDIDSRRLKPTKPSLWAAPPREQCHTRPAARERAHGQQHG